MMSRTATLASLLVQESHNPDMNCCSLAASSHSSLSCMSSALPKTANIMPYPKTHCVHGHEYTPANTILKADGSRRCRVCTRRIDRKRDAVRKERRHIRIDGDDAHFLLFAMDAYLGADTNGRIKTVKHGRRSELQRLRDRLFAIHKH